MPWNGSAPNQTYGRTDGTRTGSQTWQQADAAGVDIVAPDHDIHDQDIADAINATLKKDGGNTATSNIPMGGFTLTNVAAATARTQPARFSDVQDGKGIYVATVGGSANAITLTNSIVITAYAAGQTFKFIAASTNSGAVTINVDAVGAKDVYVGGSPLSAGMISSGMMITVTYDGTRFQMQAESPAAIPVGTIVAWPIATVPTGCLECDGSAVSRTTYSALFAVISDDYGPGDGSTTFNLPNYKDYFLRGFDASGTNAGSRTDRGDGTTGASVGTKQASDYLAHTHAAGTLAADSNGAHTHDIPFGAGEGLDAGDHSRRNDSTNGNDVTSSNGAHTHTISGSTATAPSSGGSETRPKNITVKWIILAIPGAALSFTVDGDLALDSGAAINWNGGDVTISHAANSLFFTGSSNGYLFDAGLRPQTNDGAALGATTLNWSDLFLAEGGVINWDNGDQTITQTGNTLAFAGGTLISMPGALVVGHTASVPVNTGVTNFLQVHGTDFSGGFSTFMWADDVNGPLCSFNKSRGGPIGTHTVVQANDVCGYFDFRGSDGTDFEVAARITGEVDGTPGNNDMPGRLKFSTSADGSVSPTERMRVDSKGNVVVNTAAIATTATDGFLYVPTCAGTPTGTPTTYAGRAPIVVDTTNNKLYFYSGGAWRDAGP